MIISNDKANKIQEHNLGAFLFVSSAHIAQSS